jgi:hypothetical protein
MVPDTEILSSASLPTNESELPSCAPALKLPTDVHVSTVVAPMVARRATLSMVSPPDHELDEIRESGPSPGR